MTYLNVKSFKKPRISPKEETIKLVDFESIAPHRRAEDQKVFSENRLNTARSYFLAQYKNHKPS